MGWSPTAAECGRCLQETAKKEAEAEKTDEVKLDPVKQALAKYSIIGVNPWEPEKP